MHILGIIFMFIGCFFIVVSSIGMLRLPAFYTRLHAGGKTDTLGQAFVFIGLMLHEGINLISLKMFIMIVFIFLANPTATHAIAKAAFVSGMKPWKRSD